MTDKSEDRSRAFKHHFGPRGRELERCNLQKFDRMPGLCHGGGGGGGVLKFRVDRRIKNSFFYSSCVLSFFI